MTVNDKIISQIKDCCQKSCTCGYLFYNWATF